MNNGDMPANSTSLEISERYEDGHYDQVALGLTKRETYCLHAGIPETGDCELDAIIKKGNRMKFSGLAMQGILSNPEYKGSVNHFAECSVEYADALLKALGES